MDNLYSLYVGLTLQEKSLGTNVFDLVGTCHNSFVTALLYMSTNKKRLNELKEVFIEFEIRNMLNIQLGSISSRNYQQGVKSPEEVLSFANYR